MAAELITLAIILARQLTVLCAYVAGKMGTIIGADLLNLKRVWEFFILQTMVEIGYQ